jgi:indolepyruvate ferredoxin oxidoreductase beta subunit
MRGVLAVDREAGGEAGGWQLTQEAARLLALWMSYEDTIRVADLKTRASRFARVRKEAAAKDGQIVVVTDYLKPSANEIADILPPAWAARLRKKRRRRPRRQAAHQRRQRLPRHAPDGRP